MPPARPSKQGDNTPMRALNDAAFRQGFHPIRLSSVLLPVHEVEVRATTRTGRPYGLIDKFIERTIAETRASTVSEIADVLDLQPALVDRAVRVLRRIGHLPAHSGALELTDLARESLRDEICYEQKREDRRKIYFDGYRCEPLHRRHYGKPSSFLNYAEASALVHQEERLLMLPALHQFHREALNNLARRTDRAEFNLPSNVENPQDVRPEFVYLHLYVVRAQARGGNVRHLAYAPDAGLEYDEHLSELCSSTPDITGFLDQSTPPIANQERRIRNWLAKNELTGIDPMRHPDGSWHVDLPPEEFLPTGSRHESSVGSFLDLWTVAVRVWCEDRDVRQRALLARTRVILRRAGYRPEELPDLVRRLGAQLEFPDLDVHRLRALVAEAGEQDLAEQLDLHRERTPDTP
jgi:predicted transcriptional regulator